MKVKDFLLSRCGMENYEVVHVIIIAARGRFIKSTDG